MDETDVSRSLVNLAAAVGGEAPMSFFSGLLGSGASRLRVGLLRIDRGLISSCFSLSLSVSG